MFVLIFRPLPDLLFLAFLDFLAFVFCTLIFFSLLVGISLLFCKESFAFLSVFLAQEFLARGDHPNSRENAPRMEGQMKIFRVGAHQFRESLRELLRELWLSYRSSRGMPFREWKFVFREWNFEFRELLREYPGTLRELRQWPFHPESVFPEIGVVPRLLRSSAEKNILAFLVVFLALFQKLQRKKFRARIATQTTC